MHLCLASRRIKKSPEGGGPRIVSHSSKLLYDGQDILSKCEDNHKKDTTHLWLANKSKGFGGWA
eukprot:1250766-Amphidinium_carterae.1